MLEVESTENTALGAPCMAGIPTVVAEMPNVLLAVSATCTTAVPVMPKLAVPTPEIEGEAAPVAVTPNVPLAPALTATTVADEKERSPEAVSETERAKLLDPTTPKVETALTATRTDALAVMENTALGTPAVDGVADAVAVTPNAAMAVT